MTRLVRLEGTVKQVPVGQSPKQVDVPHGDGEYVVSFTMFEFGGTHHRKTADWHWTAWVAKPL